MLPEFVSLAPINSVPHLSIRYLPQHGIYGYTTQTFARYMAANASAAASTCSFIPILSGSPFAICSKHGAINGLYNSTFPDSVTAAATGHNYRSCCHADIDNC